MNLQGFTTVSETEMLETNGGLALAVGLIGGAIALALGIWVGRN